MLSLLAPERARPAALGAALCGGGLLLSLLSVPRSAHAAAACRADPVVTLSNGATIDLNLAINTSDGTLKDVQHIAYTLHGPTGTSLASVSFPDGTGTISSVTYVPDDNAGDYDGDTIVTTGTKVSMTAYLAVLMLPTAGGKPTPTAPAQGHSGQDLHIHLHIA